MEDKTNLCGTHHFEQLISRVRPKNHRYVIRILSCFARYVLVNKYSFKASPDLLSYLLDFILFGRQCVTDSCGVACLTYTCVLTPCLFTRIVLLKILASIPIIAIKVTSKLQMVKKSWNCTITILLLHVHRIDFAKKTLFDNTFASKNSKNSQNYFRITVVVLPCAWNVTRVACDPLL